MTFRFLTLIAAFYSTLTLTADDRPNVLFIAVDDLNHWVSHLGRNSQAKTPNIDRLAAMGTTFTNAHTAVPACEPSRCALMSGRRPWVSGCYKNGHEWRKVPKARARDYPPSFYKLGTMFPEPVRFTTKWMF